MFYGVPCNFRHGLINLYLNCVCMCASVSVRFCGYMRLCLSLRVCVYASVCRIGGGGGGITGVSVLIAVRLCGSACGCLCLYVHVSVCAACNLPTDVDACDCTRGLYMQTP